MTWSELYEFLNQHHGADWWDDRVYSYDVSTGGFFPCDLVDFECSDDIIDQSAMFISFQSEVENE